MEEQFYTKQKIDAERLAAWRVAGSSLIFIALAALYYWQFSDLEEKGGSKRVNAILALVYEMMGVRGGTIFFSAIGGLLLLAGIWKLVKAYRMKQDPGKGMQF